MMADIDLVLIYGVKPVSMGTAIYLNFANAPFHPPFSS